MKTKRILKMDKNFTSLPVATGDEIFANGIFEFNVSRIIDFIYACTADFIPERVSVDDFPRAFSSINEDLVDSVQISEPVILAEISPGRYSLIDGHHRMEKARRMGIKEIMAYRLNVTQHIRFLTTKEAYLKYINYWNSKQSE